MNEHETKARELKSQGNNCSESLYNSFKTDINLDGNYPKPRSIDGKCGALLTALYILKETGNEDKIEEFEKKFVEKFGYSKCIDLMTHDRKCSDYVGYSAKWIDEILSKIIL